MWKALEAALPDAKAAAARHVEKKREKFGATIMAFVRKNGKHSTRICPKECWNENFLKNFAEVVRQEQDALSETRQTFNKKLKAAVVRRLDDMTKKIEGQHGIISTKPATVVLTISQLIRHPYRRMR